MPIDFIEQEDLILKAGRDVIANAVSAQTLMAAARYGRAIVTLKNLQRETAELIARLEVEMVD